MTNQLQQAQESDNSNLPTHTVKMRHGQGKGAHYERIGVAWENPENGSLFIKLTGTQVIGQGFSVYPIDRDDA